VATERGRQTSRSSGARRAAFFVSPAGRRRASIGVAFVLALAAQQGWSSWFAAPRVAVAHAEAEQRRDRVYLSELALLVEGSRRLLVFAEQNLDERELTRFAHPLAERYVELAGHMLPSAKVVVAHPHLILVVENLERALDAAAAGDAITYQKRSRIARDELANLEAVLKQLKLRLPELAR
jgi:hypothetical protein